MKELLLSALKEKFAGVNPAILSRMAEKKAGGITDESQIPHFVEGIGFQDVLISYGDFRANGAVASSIANYEKKYNLRDGKPVGTPEEKKEKEKKDEAPSWIQTLVEYNKVLSGKLLFYEQKEAEKQREKEFEAKAKEYGIPKMLVPLLKCTGDTDRNSFIKSIKQAFADADPQIILIIM